MADKKLDIPDQNFGDFNEGMDMLVDTLQTAGEDKEESVPAEGLKTVMLPGHGAVPKDNGEEWEEVGTLDKINIYPTKSCMQGNSHPGSEGIIN